MYIYIYIDMYIYTPHAGLYNPVSDVILLVNTTQSTITISWSDGDSITTTGYRLNYTGITCVCVSVCVCECARVCACVCVCMCVSVCVCVCVCTTTGYCLNYTLYSCDVKSLIFRNSLCLMAHNSCMHALCVCVCVCMYVCMYARM